MRVDEVDVPTVTRTLKPIWREKPETARRVLQRIASVISWSVAHGHREHELAVNALRMGLGDQAAKVTHHEAISVEDAPAMFAKIEANENLSARCLVFAILTASRSGEARGARWDEIDLQARTWTVPEDRMKAGRTHIVALSPKAIEFLENAERLQNKAGLIFPNSKGKPFSDMALLKVAKATTGGTVHGWRSTFRDWAAERTNIPGEVVEAALAHTVKNKVEAAYRRTNYLEKRRPLMAAWADYLKGAGAEIAQIDEARKLKELSG